MFKLHVIRARNPFCRQAEPRVFNQLYKQGRRILDVVNGLRGSTCGPNYLLLGPGCRACNSGKWTTKLSVVRDPGPREDKLGPSPLDQGLGLYEAEAKPFTD